jgi:putative sterol carrier protein
MAQDKKPRIPGMAWAVIAFVPWILYWVLAGTGHTTAAILLGMGVSLAINGYRLAIGKVKILDVVTLVFLAVSAFVTLVLGNDLLVFYGGVLSDATLALMAWGSLAAGNPFTYDYAKEDWDRAFWNDPIFVQTNQIITAVWGVIFSVQALVGGTSMALGLEGMARIVLVAVIPRALLAVGTAFSAWFPRWYPQRAAARQGRQGLSRAPDGLTGLRLVEFMPLAFNAGAAGDPSTALRLCSGQGSGQALQALIQFHLSGDGGGAGYLKIESGHCTFHPGEAAQPTLVIESPAEVWTAIARGEISGAEAFLSGAYRATGDLGVLMQFGKLFSSAPQARHEAGPSGVGRPNHYSRA